MNVAIVILNYLNYWDTEECLESILSNKYPLCGIVVVDNASANESYQKLAEKYADTNDIYVVKTKKNLGFAKGNNVGIQIARKKYAADFVLVINNDIIFTDPNFFDILLAQYNENVGIIGPGIELLDGNIQREIVEDLSIGFILKKYAHDFVQLYFDNVWLFLCPMPKRIKKSKVLHGCALLFTPAYFKYYSGFYPGTFLYNEEPILGMRCTMKQLSQVYVTGTTIVHKEDQASEASFGNDAQVINKYNLKSRKHLLYWAIKFSIWRKVFKKSSTLNYEIR